jgi:hypothetical protein
VGSAWPTKQIQEEKMIALDNALAPSIFSGLEVHVSPANFFVGGSVLVIPSTVVFLLPNTTSYIYLSFGGGTVGINQTAYPTADLPICTVVTDEEKILAFFDDRPDFTNMTAGGGSPHFSDAEVPSGAINGTNVTFTLLNSPTPPASAFLTLNGVVQSEGIDYTLSGQTISFTIAPVTGDQLIAWYRY